MGYYDEASLDAHGEAVRKGKHFRDRISNSLGAQFVQTLDDLVERLDKAEAALTATSRCPICALDRPHGHTDGEMADWLRGQTARFNLPWDKLFPSSIAALADEGDKP